jgi:hypothetical protein
MEDSFYDEFIFIRFNQDNSCFSTITRSGKVFIYNSYPIKSYYEIRK